MSTRVDVPTWVPFDFCPGLVSESQWLARVWGINPDGTKIVDPQITLVASDMPVGMFSWSAADGV